MAKSPGSERLVEPALPPSPVVLLLVDFINPLDFDGAEALAPPAVEAAKACAKLRSRVRSRGWQTVYANDNYGIWRSDFRALWARCAHASGAPGEIARRLRPMQGDCTILKPRHSAFHATPLNWLLQQLRCDRLIIAGLSTDRCVLFSAMDAYARGYAVWVPQDCCAAESAEAQSDTLRQMQRVLKAETRPAN